MTIAAAIVGDNVVITNDAPVATATYPKTVLESGHRGLGAQIKRDLGLGDGGQYAITEQLFTDIAAVLTVTVPDVVGMTTAEATAALQAAHLTLGAITGTVDPVASQLPVAAADAAYGSAVALTLTS